MNEPIETAERALLADIERLRMEFPKTQELYREVCTVMFFRYGMTPTANKLYQLVRKGSMSAPADALNQFWLQLRQKSRISIEHPDLPDELRSATGDLAATVWKAALACAADTLVSFRNDAQREVDQANLERAAALALRDEMDASLQKTQLALVATEERALSLQSELQVARESITQAAQRLDLAYTAIQSLQARLDESHQQRVAFHEKVRQDESKAEERREAMHKHALQEIDRERQVAIRLQKSLDAERIAGAQKAEHIRSAEQNETVLKTRLNETTAAMAAVSEQLNMLRRDATDARMGMAAQERETAILMRQVGVAQGAAEKLTAEKLTWTRERHELEEAVRELEHRLQVSKQQPGSIL